MNWSDANQKRNILIAIGAVGAISAVGLAIHFLHLRNKEKEILTKERAEELKEDRRHPEVHPPNHPHNKLDEKIEKLEKVLQGQGTSQAAGQGTSQARQVFMQGAGQDAGQEGDNGGSLGKPIKQTEEITLSMPPPPAEKKVTDLAEAYADLEKLFHLSVEKLTKIRDHFVAEMTEGLGLESKASLAMIPTFITKLPTGSERGAAYALDIGGSNLRMLKCSLIGDGKIKIDVVRQKAIPVEKQQGSAEDLFDFVAECVSEVIPQEDQNALGFTFSFPINQTAINSGTLIKWTKGFTAANVEGQDVCALLNEAMTRKHVKGRVNALINDTVGTMLAGCYQNAGEDCVIGLILGTGMNACYWEKPEGIKKFPIFTGSGMIINMECGNFGSRKDLISDLPLNKYDIQLDTESLNPGNQFLEKQISGMYLGEITRLILVDHIKAGKIFKGYEDKFPKKAYGDSFVTADMSLIESDDTAQLTGVDEVLVRYGVIASTLEERKFVKQICYIVSYRAAQLAAMTITSVLKKIGKEDQHVVVAVDGSVYEKYPKFKEMIDEALLLMLKHKKVTTTLAKDGSGIGAALASYISST